MQLSIISPTKSQLIKVDWIDIQTGYGNFVVKHGHAPMILALKSDSKITYFSDNKSITTNISEGLINIQRDSILLLVTNE